MTATNHTENYNLSQFVGTDRPTWLGDYNGDMEKIDAQLKQNADDIASATAGSLTSVSHTDDLTGNGTAGNPLGVADTIARTEDIPSLDGYATTESVAQAIAAAIADRLTAGDIKPGNGINIETSGNQVTISYVGGGSADGLTAVAHDATLTGDGTSGTPLGVVNGTALKAINYYAGDLNTLVENGLYAITGVTANTPRGDVNANGIILVQQSGDDRLQLFLTSWLDEGPINALFLRRGLKRPTLVWDDWIQMAKLSDIPDVSDLTLRIAALESQVTALTAAATPSATGLNAKQLDTQYSDDYNIVRVGTPTRSNETEESS